MKIGKYKLSEIRKAVASFLAGLAVFLGATLILVTDGSVTSADIIAIVVALGGWAGGTASVFTVKNEN